MFEEPCSGSHLEDGCCVTVVGYAPSVRRTPLALLILGLGVAVTALADGDRSRAGADTTDGGVDDDSAWICVPSRDRAPVFCPHGPMRAASERKCKDRQSSEAGVHRFRVNKGPWIDYPPRHHRCVAAPLGAKLNVRIDGWAGEVLTDRECVSRHFDVDVNFYGNLWARCSKRDTSTDEVVRSP